MPLQSFFSIRTPKEIYKCLSPKSSTSLIFDPTANTQKKRCHKLYAGSIVPALGMLMVWNVFAYLRLHCWSTLYALLSSLSLLHYCVKYVMMHPMRAPGRNASLIWFLISALYMLFACLYRMLPLLSFFFTFSSLISSHNYLFLWE